MPDAQRIVIRIRKGKDGRASLTCTRADGTVTWQRQEGNQAAFFPRHDLTHFAVETVLEQRQGFYGLIAAGWDFSDFGTPWPRGKLPAEARVSEAIVGFFDIERRTGELETAAELNRKIAEYCAEQGLPRGASLPTKIWSWYGRGARSCSRNGMRFHLAMRWRLPSRFSQPKGPLPSRGTPTTRRARKVTDRTSGEFISPLRLRIC
ncbi:MAG: hypothetical protein ABI408_11205 [Gemmatimonadaceae bacterium]